MRNKTMGYIVMYATESTVRREFFDNFLDALECYTLQTALKCRTVLLVDNDTDEIIREFHYGSGGDRVTVTTINQ